MNPNPVLFSSTSVAALLLGGMTAVAVMFFPGCSSAQTKPSPKPAATSAAPAKPAAPAPPTAAPAPEPAASGPDAAKLDAQFPRGEWRPLFDGATLRGWSVTEFAGHGDVKVEPNFRGGPALVFEQGAALTGIHWTNPVPRSNYEVSWEAMKVVGSDFFGALTTPYGDANFTFINGGWGGGVVGISSVDKNDASLNETTKYMKFDVDKWYRFRLRVTPAKIEAWIDDEQVVNLDTADKSIAMRLGEIEKSEPFGFAAWQTGAALRNLKLRRLAAVSGR